MQPVSSAKDDSFDSHIHIVTNTTYLMMYVEEAKVCVLDTFSCLNVATNGQSYYRLYLCETYNVNACILFCAKRRNRRLLFPQMVIFCKHVVTCATTGLPFRQATASPEPSAP